LIGHATALAEEARGLPRKEAFAHFEGRLHSLPLARPLLDLALAAYEGGEARAWLRFIGLLKKRGLEILEALLEEA
jgi:hypothetical protein